jgi:hypothetical protein
MLFLFFGLLVQILSPQEKLCNSSDLEEVISEMMNFSSGVLANR